MDLTRQAVVTGIGIVSSLGNNPSEVLDSLARVSLGDPRRAKLSRKRVSLSSAWRSSMSTSRRWCRDATVALWATARLITTSPWSKLFEDSGLDEERVSHPRAGIVMGSGGPSTSNQVAAADLLRAAQEHQKNRSLHGAALHEFDEHCLAGYFFQDSRR